MCAKFAASFQKIRKKREAKRLVLKSEVDFDEKLYMYYREEEGEEDEKIGALALDDKSDGPRQFVVRHAAGKKSTND